MTKFKLFGIIALMIILTLTGVACDKSTSQEESRKTAEEYIKQSDTFGFDGMPDTLRVTNTISVVDG